jgi:DNA-directed RNA polymerase specialized sigma24 family protein
VTLESKLLALRASPSKEAEAAFIIEARPFLRSVCRWYRGPDLADEDLEAEAELALVEAMREWKPGGRPFDTFARWGVRFALAKLLRSSRMIRGRGREGRMCGIAAVLHGLDEAAHGPASAKLRRYRAGIEQAELQNALSDTRGVEAGMLDVAQMVERASDVAALTEAVMELGAEDQAVVTAWLADSRGRALPLRLRERLREMVG